MGQIYFGDQAGKWVRTKSALTIGEVSWKRSKDGTSLDTAQLLKDHPEMAQTYAVTKPGSRRFLVQQ